MYSLFIHSCAHLISKSTEIEVYILFLTSLLIAYTSLPLLIPLQVLLTPEAEPCSCNGVQCWILRPSEWMEEYRGTL
jgi:hypothetical protein